MYNLVFYKNNKINCETFESLDLVKNYIDEKNNCSSCFNFDNDNFIILNNGKIQTFRFKIKKEIEFTGSVNDSVNDPAADSIVTWYPNRGIRIPTNNTVWTYLQKVFYYRDNTNDKNIYLTVKSDSQAQGVLKMTRNLHDTIRDKAVHPSAFNSFIEVASQNGKVIID